MPKTTDAPFRTFAETPATTDGIEEFISRFASPSAPINQGAVDNRGWVYLSVSTNREKRLPSDWLDQIRDLRQCVELWDLVRANDQKELARHIKWQQQPDGRFAVYYESHPSLKSSSRAVPPVQATTEIVSSENDPAFLSSLRPDDLRTAALLHIAKRVNEHLNGQVETQVSCVPQSTVLSLNAIPVDLLTGLWLQFAQAVAENKTYARCKECHGWFESSAPGTRNTRLYCSDSCKVTAYVNRKDRAVELKAEGKSVKQIAKELETDKDTVKRWLRRMQ
jgi:hypothetical protein